MWPCNNQYGNKVTISRSRTLQKKYKFTSPFKKSDMYITHQDGGSSPHKTTPWIIILHIMATEQYNQWGLW